MFLIIIVWHNSSIWFWWYRQIYILWSQSFAIFLDSPFLFPDFSNWFLLEEKFNLVVTWQIVLHFSLFLFLTWFAVMKLFNSHVLQVHGVIVWHVLYELLLDARVIYFFLSFRVNNKWSWAACSIPSACLPSHMTTVISNYCLSLAITRLIIYVSKLYNRCIVYWPPDNQLVRCSQ